MRTNASFQLHQDTSDAREAEKAKTEERVPFVYWTPETAQ